MLPGLHGGGGGVKGGGRGSHSSAGNARFKFEIAKFICHLLFRYVSLISLQLHCKQPERGVRGKTGGHPVTP